jgi:hypothetical protein
MRIRDELGEVYADARFTAAFGVRGRPGISAGQLMMASMLQFSENLTGRQAAEAVRGRITWKYTLGPELDDPGFDAVLLDTSAQARAGAGIDKASFSFDFDARQATCPQGVTSSSWNPCRPHQDEAIVVSWPKKACTPCPARTTHRGPYSEGLNRRPKARRDSLPR